MGLKGDDLNKLMKQAQEMQKKMQDMQKEVASKKVVGRAGGDLVKVKMNGKHDVTKVFIDSSLLKDKEMLEDLVAAAVNDAVRQVEDMTKETMSGLAKDMDLPFDLKPPETEADTDE